MNSASRPVVVLPSTFTFLGGLKQNNNRAWFERHRAEYEAARANVLEIVDHLIAGIAGFDPPIAEQEAEDCLFRIYRDVRFSGDKHPYKTNFGAFMTDRGRKVTRAGYYVHVEPGASLLAGGLYMPPGRELRAVRQAIMEDASGLREIIGTKNFARHFGTGLRGARLKTAPRDIAKDHPDIDLLGFTSFEVWCDLKDGRLCREDFVRQAVQVFKAMHPLVAWLNSALDRHVLPET